MISDVLFEAIGKIDNYLSDEIFKGCYEGKQREEIVALRNRMMKIQKQLDTPPSEGREFKKERVREITGKRP